MKTSIQKLIAVATLLIPAALQAHPGDLSNVLALYNFNNLTCNWENNPPSYLAPCVCASDITLNRLCQGYQPCGGPDGSAFRTFSGWDTSYDYSFARTDFSSVPGTLSYDVFVKNDAIANISGVSFDWMRPDSNSVDAIQATIFWQGTTGGIQYCSTGPISLNGTGNWNSRELDFPIDVTPLPTGIDTTGKQFHIELYAWGSGAGPLYLDNVALIGDCAPIPEPGGALLIAATGMLLLLRRRFGV